MNLHGDERAGTGALGSIHFYDYGKLYVISLELQKGHTVTLLEKTVHIYLIEVLNTFI